MNFTQEVYKKIVNDLKESMKLTDEEVQRLEKSKTGKIIAGIPYIAECNEPARYSLANLSTLILAGRNREIFDMKSGETIENRLDPIYNFKGGKKEVIEKGMKLLELISLEDHLKDKDEDSKIGKYNPVLKGDLDYEKEKKRILEDINILNNKEKTNAEFDAIAKPDELKGAFWM